MGWLDTQRRLPTHAAILTVSERELTDFEVAAFVLKILKEVQHTPEQLQNLFQDVVVKFRPELANCQVWWIDFDASWQAWHLGVYHPALPAVCAGAQLPKERLIKGEGN